MHDEEEPLKTGQALSLLANKFLLENGDLTIRNGYQDMATLEFSRRVDPARIDAKRFALNPIQVIENAHNTTSHFYHSLDVAIEKIAKEDSRQFGEPSIENEKIIAALGGDDALTFYKHMVEAAGAQNDASFASASRGISTEMRHSRFIQQEFVTTIDNSIAENNYLKSLLKNSGDKGAWKSR